MSAITDSARQYRTLDALRGVAALSIVILHVPHFFEGWHLPGSFLAVDLFFGLSGFVLASAYERRFARGLGVAAFMRRRIVRLYPLYLLSSALGVAVAVAALHHRGLSIEWSPARLAATVPLAVLMAPARPLGASDVLYPLNPVLWSIAYELLVNLAYVVCYRWLRSDRVLAAVIAAGAAALVGTTLMTGTLDAGYSWATIANGGARVTFSFFLGVLIQRRSRDADRHESAWFAALPVAVIAAFALPATVPLQLTAVLLIFPAILWTGARLEPAFARRAINALGVSSYAVYALHKPVYQLLLGTLTLVLPIRPEKCRPVDRPRLSPGDPVRQHSRRRRI